MYRLLPNVCLFAGGGPGLTVEERVLGGAGAEKEDGMKETWTEGWREGG